MLFTMIERGMDADVLGDKGKLRATASAAPNGEDAMWAVILTKELWRKQIWSDAKSVSIVALGCFHPVIKVQSASLHFFLGSDQDKEDSDEESDQASNISFTSLRPLIRHRKWISEHSITVARSTKRHAVPTKNSKSGSTPPKKYVHQVFPCLPTHKALYTEKE